MYAGVQSKEIGLQSLSDCRPAIHVLAHADQTILDAIPAAVYVCASDGVILRFNRHAAGLWGRVPSLNDPRDRYTGAFRLLATGGRPLSGAETPVASVLRGGEASYGREVVAERPDGTRAVLLCDIEPIHDELGNVTGAVSCFRDITARKQAEQELERRGQDLEDFFENGAVGLHLVSGDGIIMRANQAELDMLGYAAGDYVGHRITEFHVDPDVIEDILKRLSTGERLDRYPARMRASDGSIKHVLITSNAHFRDGEFLNTRCFTVDVTKEHKSHEALTERDRQAREILDALPAAVYTTDAEGRITFYNEAAVDFSGRTPELGSDSWCVTWRLHEPDGTPLPHDQCPMAVALKEGRAIRGAEAVAERPDGTRVPFIPFPTPLRDASGRLIGAVNMLVDISERKRAEEEQRALIHELNHRVKNTLATVQAIASQTSRTTTDPRTFNEKFSNRVRALSNAHDLLTERRWTGLAFRDLLEAELRPYGEVGSNRVRLDGDDILLPTRVALILVMVLHELATNAAKYGSLSCGGSVALSWTCLGHNPPLLSIDWKELDGPPVSAPEARGFGTSFIERSLSRDLEGDVSIAFDRTGLSCSMVIPLS